MKKILQKEASVLRKIAEDVPIESIGSKELSKIIDEMKEALWSQDDGVAIAAPQIGYPLRIFIVSKRVEAILREEKDGKFEDEPKDTSLDMVFINPVIKKVSKERRFVEE